jgi:hypothetical protein
MHDSAVNWQQEAGIWLAFTHCNHPPSAHQCSHSAGHSSATPQSYAQRAAGHTSELSAPAHAWQTAACVLAVEHVCTARPPKKHQHCKQVVGLILSRMRSLRSHSRWGVHWQLGSQETRFEGDPRATTIHTKLQRRRRDRRINHQRQPLTTN